MITLCAANLHSAVFGDGDDISIIQLYVVIYASDRVGRENTVYVNDGAHTDMYINMLVTTWQLATIFLYTCVARM